MDHATGRGALYREEATIARASSTADGSALAWRLLVKVTWTFPVDGKEHAYELERTVARPGLAHLLAPRLEEPAR